MKKSLAAIAVLSVLGLTACGEQSEETQSTATATTAAELETPIARQSYSIGASMGSFALSRQEQLEGLDMSLDMEVVRQGFNAGWQKRSVLTSSPSSCNATAAITHYALVRGCVRCWITSRSKA